LIFDFRPKNGRLISCQNASRETARGVFLCIYAVFTGVLCGTVHTENSTQKILSLT